MILDPLKTYADVRPKDRVVTALFTGVEKIPDWAMQRRIVVEASGGVQVGWIYYDGGFRAPPTAAPPDYSDIDKLEKQTKAMGLSVAELSGITVKQMKTLFESKYNSLP